MKTRTFAYISCWNNLGGAPGLGIADFDQETGEIKLRTVEYEDLSCGFSFVDNEKNILYVCNETENHPDYFQGGGGRLFAFAINKETGELTELSSVRTFCPNPCQMSLAPSGQYMAVANHSAYNAVTKILLDENGHYTCRLDFDDAAVEVFRMNQDGTFGDLLDIDRHVKHAKGRAQHSHPQSVAMSPSGNFFICTDVGEHTIYSYRIDPVSGKLSVLNIFQDEPGSKPRCCLFHPTLPLLYINYEGRSYLRVFRYTENGSLTSITTVDGAPSEVQYPAGKGQSGLLMDPSGSYIYALMSATASIAVYVLEKDGMPTQVQYLPSRENKLRAIALSPNGKYLLTTCLQSGSIDVYAVGKNGLLTTTDHRATLKGSAFVTFFHP